MKWRWECILAGDCEGLFVEAQRVVGKKKPDSDDMGEVQEAVIKKERGVVTWEAEQEV